MQLLDENSCNDAVEVSGPKIWNRIDQIDKMDWKSKVNLDY